MVPSFAKAYDSALDAAARHATGMLQLLADPSTSVLQTLQDQATSSYYPKRAEQLKAAYYDYYTQMRRTLASLLDTHAHLHQHLDAIGGLLETIYTTAELNTAMLDYFTRRIRWESSWTRYLHLLNPYGNSTTLVHAYHYHRDLNATFRTTLDLVQRAETDLRCILARVDAYEAEIRGAADVVVSVLEVQRLEWSVRQMRRQVDDARDLRAAFDPAVKRYYALLTQPFRLPGSWEILQKEEAERRARRKEADEALDRAIASD
ncbi:hypothetical protein MMC34_000567 [Xylographa carneopallida]|nr:hypothetical protein [Xylographa carneopallida]